MTEINNRKSEHIKLAIEQFKFNEVLANVQLLHDSLPGLNIDEIDLQTSLCGYSITAPIMLNAITGGSEEAFDINKKLAMTAKELNLPMAVGSQKIALTDTSAQKSFKVVREKNPNGIIFANLGSYADPVMAQEACQMLEADGIQIHLNVPQELAMAEGDRNFKNVLNNIHDIVKSLELPVIVKEVGFGMTSESIKRLINIGVDAIDISGNKGTDFVKLENDRLCSPRLPSMESWGLTPGQSLLEANRIDTSAIDIIAAGGFSNVLDIAKAISLGAGTVAMAGYPLYLLTNYGQKELVSALSNILDELTSVLLICGAKNLSELRQVPLIITKDLLEFAQNREIDISKYANRTIK